MLKEEDKRIMKETMHNVGLSFLMLVPLYIYTLLFKPSFLGLLLGVYLFQIGLLYFNKTKIKPQTLIWTAFTTYVFLWILYYLTYTIGAWGFLGLLIIIGVIVARILYMRWELYMRWIRHIESRFFGMTAEERREQRRRKNG